MTLILKRPFHASKWVPSHELNQLSTSMRSAQGKSSYVGGFIWDTFQFGLSPHLPGWLLLAPTNLNCSLTQIRYIFLCFCFSWKPYANTYRSTICKHGGEHQKLWTIPHCFSWSPQVKYSSPRRSTFYFLVLFVPSAMELFSFCTISTHVHLPVNSTARSTQLCLECIMMRQLVRRWRLVITLLLYLYCFQGLCLIYRPWRTRHCGCDSDMLLPLQICFSKFMTEIQILLLGPLHSGQFFLKLFCPRAHDFMETI